MAKKCYKNSNCEYTYYVIKKKLNSKGFSGKYYHKLLRVISFIILLVISK
jgi:hypothetical protein